MKKYVKIGVVQNFSICGDFSRNLRTIVQGYRDCIDQGADVVVASAYSLAGAQAKDLCQRESYLHQSKLALTALAQEINCAPLVLASYSKELTAGEHEELSALYGDGNYEMQLDSRLTPFLLTDGVVVQLQEAEVISLMGMSFSIEIGDEESVLDLPDLDFSLRLTTQSWHTRAVSSADASRRWEAQMNRAPLVSVNAVGLAEGCLYAGGSAVYGAAGELLGRLDYFREDSRVIALDAPALPAELPTEPELLHQALVMSIQKSVEQGGYKGVCLAMDHLYAPLLLLLASEAVGVSRVQAICYGAQDVHAASLGVDYQLLDVDVLAEQLRGQAHLADVQARAMQQRLRACITMGVAESRHSLLLSALHRQQIILGDFILFGQSCAHLLPLGSLDESEICRLIEWLAGFYPEYFTDRYRVRCPELESILHETYDVNQGFSQLMHEHPDRYLEGDVRYVQRRCAAAAVKHASLPLKISTQPEAQQHDYPCAHRLLD